MQYFASWILFPGYPRTTSNNNTIGNQTKPTQQPNQAKPTQQPNQTKPNQTNTTQHNTTQQSNQHNNQTNTTIKPTQHNTTQHNNQTNTKRQRQPRSYLTPDYTDQIKPPTTLELPAGLPDYYTVHTITSAPWY